MNTELSNPVFVCDYIHISGSFLVSPLRIHKDVVAFSILSGKFLIS